MLPHKTSINLIVFVLGHSNLFVDIWDRFVWLISVVYIDPSLTPNIKFCSYVPFLLCLDSLKQDNKHDDDK